MSSPVRTAEMPEVLVIQRLPIQWQLGFLVAEQTSDFLVFEKDHVWRL